MQVAPDAMRLVLNNEQVNHLVSKYGTPIYVISESVFLNRINAYKSAFQQNDPKIQLGFATKSNSALAILRLASQQNLLLDVASEGELRAAIAAGVSPQKCYLHGNNKSDSEVNMALEHKIHHFVADNWLDLNRIAATGSDIPIVIRLAPGVDPVTHEKIRTGQSDTKFGFPIREEILDSIANFILKHSLNFIGFHCHVGSQLLDPKAQMSGGELIAKATSHFANKHNIQTRLLNVGGGLGVAYTTDQLPLDFNTYNQLLCPPIREVINETAPNAVLMQEPGRSLVSDAGVTLYSVGPIKSTILSDGTEKNYLSVNGGIADNPRPALYHAQYTVLDSYPNSDNKIEYTISGRHCETDTLFPQTILSENVKTGDTLQVLCTGAYNASMANNYNRYPRPAMVLIRLSGEFSMIQRAESYDEMFSREIIPSDL